MPACDPQHEALEFRRPNKNRKEGSLRASLSSQSRWRYPGIVAAQRRLVKASRGARFGSEADMSGATTSQVSEVSRGPGEGIARRQLGLGQTTYSVPPAIAGERGVSLSAFVLQSWRRSTGSYCRSRDCLPESCLCGSSPRTSDTGSPNSGCPGLIRSRRTTGPGKPGPAAARKTNQQEQRWQLRQCVSSLPP